MPTIKKPNSHFDAVLWTGDGTSSKTISSYNFAPDLVWAKNRSDTSIGWSLYDTIRGAGAEKELATHQNYAEGGDNHDTYGYLSAFTSNGFTGSNGSGSPNYYFNKSSSTYVAYGWKAGGASTVNTSGTISSNVSVNTTAGFSVATYTGNGSAGATIGHGLGAAPKFIIIKKRSSTADWDVYHSSLGATKALYLNRTDGQQTDTTFWNDTAPSTTLTTFGTSPDINSNGVTYVMYSWAEIAGFSAFGSYTGNASTDGPFVYLGFKPKFVIIKKSSGAGEWAMFDGVRETYNPEGSVAGRLKANAVDAESGADSAQYMDFLSNGFKIRSNSSFNNDSGGTYIYIAFAESPFKFTTAR